MKTILLLALISPPYETIRKENGLVPGIIEIAKVRNREGSLRSERTYDQEVEFRREWNRLLSLKLFVRAKRYLNTKGAFLTTAKRQAYLQDLEKECHAYVRQHTRAFLSGLEKFRRPEEVRNLTPRVFQDRYAIPSRKNLVVTSLELQWCLSVRKTLGEIRKGKQATGVWLVHALDAIPLTKQGKNPWFSCTEAFAYRSTREDIARCVTKARTATKVPRAVLWKQVQSERDQWLKFDRAIQKVLPRNPSFAKIYSARDLNKLLKAFPISCPGLTKIPQDIETSLGSKDPTASLSKVERTLQALRKNASRYTIESRRGLVRCLIATRALRSLLALETVEGTARDLEPLGEELRLLGGSFIWKHFGPKVQAVLDILRRGS